MKLKLSGRIFTMFIILNLSAAVLAADDGSWSLSFDISGGSIYSDREDEDIVLEKELLIFTGLSTEAHFLFRNTSSREIVLDCGFPVVHRIDSYPSEAGAEIPVSKYGRNDIPVLGFFQTVPNTIAVEEESPELYPELVPFNAYNNSREYIGRDIPDSAGIEFSISQDGNDVEIDNILLERLLDSESISLTFHFKHKLRFPANGTTVVSVSYSQDLLYGNNGSPASDVFKWNYIIGTGATWKGPIGDFVFIKPSSWRGEVAGPEKISANPGVEIYHAGNWEPERDQEFSLGSVPVSMNEEFSLYSEMEDFISIWNSGLSRMNLPDAPVQSFVKEVRASSALSDELDVFLENGMTAGAGFQAVSAFDGFEETSWCENVRGRGEGEYLEALIDRPVNGIEIRNGFKRMPFDDWVYETGTFERTIRDDKSGFRDYYSLNSRVKTLEVTDSAGNPVCMLELADERDPQIFFGLNLQPGRYRFVIKETYGGSRWDDTCIAEISFIAKKDKTIDKLYSDPFYSRFFRTLRYE